MGIGKCALILAAGKGTRMRSEKPKVLHTILGEPMLACVLAALKPLFGAELFIVAGHKAEAIRDAFPGARIIQQEPQLGTGHALKCALESPEISQKEYILVANGDTPMLEAECVEKFISQAMGADIAFASITLADAGNYGRVIRRGEKLLGIVEAKDYRENLHGAPSGEINSGLWLVRPESALALLPQLDCKNSSGEYYLTDMVELGLKRGLDVRGIQLGDMPELLGVNTPAELAAMENRMAEKINMRLLQSGVVIHHPAALRVGPAARVEPGVELNGPAQIFGNTHIERGSSIGPFCYIKNSHIGPDCQALSFCHLENAEMAQNSRIGPYTRLRPGAKLESGAHVGNFVELKNAVLGEGAKANHLAYLGDAKIGAHANIGAGTITCNYDGAHKHRTEIGANAFIGSNASLVAPVEIGENALVGAGSVITKNVPEDCLAIGRAKQKILPRKRLDPNAADSAATVKKQ